MTEDAKSLRDLVIGFKAPSGDGDNEKTLVSKALECIDDASLLSADAISNGVELVEFSRGTRSVLFKIIKDGQPTGELARVSLYNGGVQGQAKRLMEAIREKDHDYRKEAANDQDELKKFTHTKTNPDYPLRIPPRRIFRHNTEYGEFEVAIIPQLSPTNDPRKLNELKIASEAAGCPLTVESGDIRQVATIPDVPQTGWQGFVNRVTGWVDGILGTENGLPVLVDGHVSTMGADAKKWPDRISYTIRNTISLTPELKSWNIDDVAKSVPNHPFTRVTEGETTYYECGSLRFDDSGKYQGNADDRSAELETLLKQRIQDKAFDKPVRISSVVALNENSLQARISRTLDRIKPIKEAMATAWVFAKEVTNGFSGGTSTHDKLFELLEKEIPNYEALNGFKVVKPNLGLLPTIAIEHTGSGELPDRSKVEEALNKLNEEFNKQTGQTVRFPWSLFMPGPIIAIMPGDRSEQTPDHTNSGGLDNLLHACRIENENSRNPLQRMGAAIADGLLALMKLEHLKDHDFILAAATSGQNTQAKTK